MQAVLLEKDSELRLVKSQLEQQLEEQAELAKQAEQVKHDAEVGSLLALLQGLELLGSSFGDVLRMTYTYVHTHVQG